MRIEIQLEPIEGDTSGAFHVCMIDADDEAHAPGRIGTVHPIAPGEWQFKPTGFKEGDHVLTVRADGPEELQKAISARCIKFAAQAPQSMTPGLMRSHALSVARSLNVLACHTETLSGFYAGIADAMAQSLIEDFAPDQQEGARAAFIDCLDKFIGKARAREETSERLREAMEGGPLGATMGDLVKDLLRTLRPDDDTPTTKH
jgi:hypothetical protein